MLLLSTKTHRISTWITITYNIQWTGWIGDALVHIWEQAGQGTSCVQLTPCYVDRKSRKATELDRARDVLVCANCGRVDSHTAVTDLFCKFTFKLFLRRNCNTASSVCLSVTFSPLDPGSTSIACTAAWLICVWSVPVAMFDNTGNRK